MATFLCSNQSSFRDIMINGKKKFPYLTITNSSIIFLIGTHSMQGWAATAWYGVVKKEVKKD